MNVRQWQVRDEIAAVLGREASVSEVLRAMCDKRLIPTPWLNQACCLACVLPTHCLLHACKAARCSRALAPDSGMHSSPGSQPCRYSSRTALQAFREPLYLTDRPVQLPDTRTEEELKYPELFRHGSRKAAALRAPQRLTAS